MCTWVPVEITGYINKRQCWIYLLVIIECMSKFKVSVAACQWSLQAGNTRVCVCVLTISTIKLSKYFQIKTHMQYCVGLTQKCRVFSWAFILISHPLCVKLLIPTSRLNFHAQHTTTPGNRKLWTSMGNLHSALCCFIFLSINFHLCLFHHGEKIKITRNNWGGNHLLSP